MLKIKRRRFFILLKKFQDNPATFSIQHQRKDPTRTIAGETEKAIIKELSTEKSLIQNKEIPIRSYNYSYIKDRLEAYSQKVSLSTIIDRAKKYGFYLKKPKRSAHDREVLTNYAGELIQHDSSFHLWSSAAREKWRLITPLDDYSHSIFRFVQGRDSVWRNHQKLTDDIDPQWKQVLQCCGVKLLSSLR
ncbi:MAG: hypothetical protein HY796_13000 [Elusimicrobia bacterium]|nr:hypothetical protein [Elusimicrobiota bacterium]